MKYTLKNKDQRILDFEIQRIVRVDEGIPYAHFELHILNVSRETLFNDLSGLVLSQEDKPNMEQHTKTVRSAYKSSTDVFSVDHLDKGALGKKGSRVAKANMDLFIDPFTGFYDKLIEAEKDVRDYIPTEDSFGDNKAKPLYLPYGASSHGPIFADWLKKRFMPMERHKSEDLLAYLLWVYNHRHSHGEKEPLTEKSALKLDTNLQGIGYTDSTFQDKNPFLYIEQTYGVSLNDTFWICPVDSTLQWEDVNPYKKELPERIGRIAFSGLDSDYFEEIDDQSFSSIVSPEYTTDGVLRKRWLTIDGQLFLAKGAKPDYNGYEPYLEIYASQFADYLHLPHVSYRGALVHDGAKDIFVSLCPLFTSEEEGYVSIHKLLERQFHKGYLTKRNLADSKVQKVVATLLGEQFFEDMMLFDALIGNGDRHWHNVGCIVHNKTGDILRPAPLFDHGVSFCVHCHDANFKDLLSYVDPVTKNRTPWGMTFMEQGATFVRPRHRHLLERVKTFTFSPVETEVLKEPQLRAMEALLRHRAERFLRILS